MRPYRDSKLTYIILGVFFLIALGYALFEAQGMFYGPSITITSSASEVTTAYFVVSGHADRIASLSMNGKVIPVTEAGVFAQPYLLAPGYNRIVLDATDRYGRKRTQALEIVYKAPVTPEEALPTLSASTSSIEKTATSTASSTPPMAQ